MINENEMAANLLCDAKQIILAARENAVKSVDFCRVQMYLKLGRRIYSQKYP